MQTDRSTSESSTLYGNVIAIPSGRDTQIYNERPTTTRRQNVGKQDIIEHTIVTTHTCAWRERAVIPTIIQHPHGAFLCFMSLWPLFDDFVASGLLENIENRKYWLFLKRKGGNIGENSKHTTVSGIKNITCAAGQTTAHGG